MLVWNVLHGTCCKYRTQKVVKNRHLGTIAQLCRAISSQLRHVSTIGKKLVKQQYLLHTFPQYGELQPTSGRDRSGSLGYPCKFQRVLRLGSVTARHSSIGRQPNFAALNRGRHLYSAGRPSRWALAHILVTSSILSLKSLHVNLSATLMSYIHLITLHARWCIALNYSITQYCTKNWWKIMIVIRWQILTTSTNSRILQAKLHQFNVYICVDICWTTAYKGVWVHATVGSEAKNPGQGAGQSSLKLDHIYKQIWILCKKIKHMYISVQPNSKYRYTFCNFSEAPVCSTGPYGQ